jgi:type VI secretion system protein ImpE
MNAHDLFHEGKLTEAIAAVTDDVRQRPTDTARRLLLAELLCFTGDLERADKHLDAIGHQDAKSLTWVQVFRHLIRGEQDRQEYFSVGHVPEFIGLPEPAERRLMEAAIRVREGALAEAAEILDQAEAERLKPAGTANEKTFDDFRDLDDLTPSILEVITSGGKYYWIPFSRIESIEFFEPERPKDLLWRRARLVVTDGPDGEVYIPVMYPGSAAGPDDAVRMGRTTDWKGGEGTPIRGLGQRTFLVGEDAIPIMELESVTFDPPAEAAPTAEGSRPEA